MKSSQKSLFSPWTGYVKPYGHFMGSDAVFPSVKQNLMEMHGSAIEKLQITCNMHNICWETIQRVMAAKPTELSRHIMMSWHIVAESHTYLPFLLLRWVWKLLKVLLFVHPHSCVNAWIHTSIILTFSICPFKCQVSAASWVLLNLNAHSGKAFSHFNKKDVHLMRHCSPIHTSQMKAEFHTS
jgi:hypothetical protein